MNQIKKGVIAQVQRTQDISDADECLPFYSGWDERLLLDKALNNEVMEVHNINLPE